MNLFRLALILVISGFCARALAQEPSSQITGVDPFPFVAGGIPAHGGLNQAFHQKTDMLTLFGPNWATMSPYVLQGSLIPIDGTSIILNSQGQLQSFGTSAASANVRGTVFLGAADGAAQLDGLSAISANIAEATWTNAIERTLGVRFSDGINVKDFGAVGDGSSDSTSAFVNALAVATTLDLGGTVIVPQGHYVVKQSLVVTLAGDTGIHLRGAGIGETMIEFQIPSGASNYDGIDLNGLPPSCYPATCFDWNGPWRGSGLAGVSQGQSSTIEDLTLKVTGGPGYPAGSMIAATEEFGIATETPLPWLTVRNVEGMTKDPNLTPAWVNGIKLTGVQNVDIDHFYFDDHSSRTPGSPGTDAGGFVAGAGVLIAASSIYDNQTQGVNLKDVQVGGFQAAFAAGGIAQGIGADGLNCASVGGGDEYCVVLGGGVIFDQGSVPHFSVPGYENGADYRVWVSSTSGIARGQQIIPVPSSGNQGGLPDGSVVDQIGSTATNGFYPISWSVTGENTTQTISGDTCVFTPSTGSPFTATCAASVGSSILTLSSAGGSPAANAGMVVTDKTNPSAIPSGQEIWQIIDSTHVLFRPIANASTAAYLNQNPFTGGTASAPDQYNFAAPAAYVADDPFGTGGVTLDGLDCAYTCVYAPISPFDAQQGWNNIVASKSQAQSSVSPLNVIGSSSFDQLHDWVWNNGSGTFLAATDDTSIQVYNSVLDGNTTNTPAIQLAGTTGASVYDVEVLGNSPLGSDTTTGNLWGLNYWNGAPRLGLPGTPLHLDSPLSGCLEMNSGALWMCGISGTIPPATSLLLTPLGALPLPGTTTSSAGAAAGATSVAVVNPALWSPSMLVQDTSSGATGTVQSISGSVLTLYAPGLTKAVASGDTIANGYSPLGELGAGITPADGALLAQGGCSDSTINNRSMISLGQQFVGIGTGLGGNGNNFLDVPASTIAGALFAGLSINTYPSTTIPAIEVTNSNASGGASISCGFSATLEKAP